MSTVEESRRQASGLVMNADCETKFLGRSRSHPQNLRGVKVMFRFGERSDLSLVGMLLYLGIGPCYGGMGSGYRQGIGIAHYVSMRSAALYPAQMLEVL